MERVHLPYWEWEEYHAGMWRKVYGSEREEYLNKAISFTGNAELYGSWMLKAIEAWPKSCEHNLTNIASNRKAWIGHAACTLATGCPEDITRLAWGKLSKQQQEEANKKAQEAIERWELDYEAKNSKLHFGLEIQGVFCWNS